jgi:2-keto-4-pentenoate hydratase/2-oxohepta-3-ene-1,7-dioic acid hydratase in catechol pathway
VTHNVPAVRPEKTFCVGLNYRSHIEETNSRRPEYPTLFAKFPDSLTGAEHSHQESPSVVNSA